MECVTDKLGGNKREPELQGQRPAVRIPDEGRAGLAAGELRALAADGNPLLLMRCVGSQKAFRTARASRGESLQNGDLSATLRRLRREVDSGPVHVSSAAGGEPPQDA